MLPITQMAGTVTRDAELAGTPLRTGDEIVLLYESTNFDDAHFADPETFDMGRSPRDHLAFGFGAHFCLGGEPGACRGAVESTESSTASPTSSS